MSTEERTEQPEQLQSTDLKPTARRGRLRKLIVYALIVMLVLIVAWCVWFWLSD